MTLKFDGEIHEDNLFLYVEVSDTGIGIKEEDIQILFEKFKRIEENRNRNIEGTGLGINITSDLLKLMGSKIEIKSEYGKGSRFYFTIKQRIVSKEEIGDLEKRIKMQFREYEYRRSFTAPSARVLVVDDNPVNIKVFRSLLKDTRIRIVDVDSGMKCLEKAVEEKYDLIFLDYMMPDMNGNETLHKLKQLSGNKNISTPVIMLTANAVKGAKEQYLKEGFDSYLSKPISPQKLDSMLKEMLPKDKVIISNDNITEETESEDIELPDVSEFDWAYSRLYLEDNKIILSTLEEFYSSIDLTVSKYLEWLEHLDEETIEQFRINVHALKSTTKMLGALTISGLSRAAELAAASRQFDRVNLLIPIIVDTLQGIHKELKPYLFRSTSVSNMKSIDETELNRIMDQLNKALIDRDYDQMDELIERISEVNLPEDKKDRISDLIGLIQRLDILEALNVIKEIN